VGTPVVRREIVLDSCVAEYIPTSSPKSESTLDLRLCHCHVNGGSCETYRSGSKSKGADWMCRDLPVDGDTADSSHMSCKCKNDEA
jgi:hypothetical protein